MQRAASRFCFQRQGRFFVCRNRLGAPPIDRSGPTGIFASDVAASQSAPTGRLLRPPQPARPLQSARPLRPADALPADTLALSVPFSIGRSGLGICFHRPLRPADVFPADTLLPAALAQATAPPCRCLSGRHASAHSSSPIDRSACRCFPADTLSLDAQRSGTRLDSTSPSAGAVLRSAGRHRQDGADTKKFYTGETSLGTPQEKVDR